MNRKKTILVVDDQPKNLQLAAYVLSSAYELILVNSGEKGIKMASKKMPDLILLDIMMPEMSGYEVCTVLKNDPLVASIPIIFLTAKIAEEDLIRAYDVGGVDYVTKPFRAKELLLRINTQIALRDSLKKIERYNDSLMALNDNKDKLFSAVAHDLRGSSNQITSLIEIIFENLKQNLNEADLEKPLSLLKDSSSRNVALVDDLLGWSKNQFNTVNLKLEELQAWKIIDKVIDQQTPAFTKKKITVHNEVAPDQVILADQGSMEFVCRNLLSNAIKFTKQEGKIRFSNFAKDIYDVIEVNDDGIGMERSQAEDLMKGIGNSSRKGTSGEGGTGIGLRLCNDFLQKHGGHLKVDSMPGKGTSFQLWIPHFSSQLEEAKSQKLHAE